MSTEPLHYADVQDEYRAWTAKFPGAADQMSMADWAQATDAQEKSNRREAGYTPNTLKDISAGADRLLRPVSDLTGQAGGAIGSKLDEWMGTTKVQPVLKELGSSLPRDVLETLPFMAVPVGGEVKAGAKIAQRFGTVAKILGAADAGARTYTETDSPAAAAVSAVTLPVADKAIHVATKLGADAVLNPLIRQLPKAADIGERAAPEVLDKLTSDPLTKIQTWLAGGTAGAAAGGTVNELSRQAMLATQGVGLLDERRNPFTAENMIAQTAGAAMQYAPLIVKGAIDRTGVNSEGYQKLMEWGTTRAKARLAALGVDPGVDPLQTLINQSAEKLPADWVGPVLEKRLSEMSNLPADQRSSAARELANIVRGRAPDNGATPDDELAKQAQHGFMRAQIDPPKNPEEVAALASRVNQLKLLAFGLIDEANETSTVDKKFKPGLKKGFEVTEEEAQKTTSSESIKTLVKGKYLPDITADFLRQQFGESVDRTLNGDDRVAFQQLSQKVANVYLELHDLAMERRRQDLAQQSTSFLNDPNKDIPTLHKFFEALAKVPDSDSGLIGVDLKPIGMRKALLDRFLKIDENDTSQYLTSLPNYLKTITAIVDHLDTNKAQDWVNTPGTFNVVQRMEVHDPVTGELAAHNETVPTQATLRQLVELDANGQYVYRIKPMKRSAEFGGKSQRELEVPESISIDQIRDPNATTVDETYNGTGEEFNSPDVSEAPVEPADTITTQAQTPGSAPFAETAAKLRTKLDTISDEDLWNTVQHVFSVNTGRGTTKVLAGVKEAKLPLLKKAIIATMEAGPASESKDFGSATGISDAARDFLTATKRKPSGEGDVRDLKAAVRDFWKGSTTDWFTRVSEVIKSLTDDGQAAGVNRTMTDEERRELFLDAPRAKPGIPEDDMWNAAKILNTHYRRLGYEPALVDHFTKLGIKTIAAFHDVNASFQTMSKDLAYDSPPRHIAVDTATMKTVLMNSFNDLTTAGRFVPDPIRLDGTQRRPMIELALDHTAGSTDPRALVAKFTMSVLLHELIHGVQLHAEQWNTNTPTTPFMRERIKSWQQMNFAAKLYAPSERLAMLSTIAQATIPKEVLFKDGKMNETIQGMLHYGSNIENDKSYEFVNTIGELLGVGMIQGGNGIELKAQHVFNWLPEEVQLFSKGIYRDLSDNIAGVKQAVMGLTNSKYDPAFLASQLAPLIEQTSKMVRAIRPEDASRMADDVMSSFAPSFASNTDAVKDAVKNQNYSDPLGAGVDKVFDAKIDKGTSQDAVKEAQSTLFGTGIDRKPAVHIPWYFGRFVPFFTLLQRLQRQGIGLASDVQNVLTDLQPSASRASTRMMSPFLMQNDNGRLVFNPDHPTFKLVQGKGRDGLGRSALNKILDWQQDKQLEAFEQGQNGTWQPTKESKATVEGILKQVPPDQHQAVIASVLSVQDSFKEASKLLLESYEGTAGYRVARLVQRLEPQVNWKEAEQLGLSAVRVAKMNNPQLAQQLFQGLKPETAAAVASLVSGPNGLAPNLVKLEQNLVERPWFATRQRPGRYILESVDKNGETNIDGAQSLGHAKAIAQQLEARGHTKISTYDKFDKNQLTKFDAPDQIFDKYTEIEQAQWDQFLRDNPAKLAPDVVDSLRETYVPGTDVSKDLTSRGVKKYLMKREEVPAGLGHDYLDNLRDYVTNLSGSVSKRNLRQRTGLITNDATVANQVEFKLAVKDQVEHVLTPTPDSFQALKSFTSAYYLGANLSSMLVEMSQGPQTLIPLLMDRGQDKSWGVGKSYKTLGRSIRDMVWVGREANQVDVSRLAAQGEAKMIGGREADMTKEESVAYLYRRALNEGVLDHGAIEDVNFGQDQKMLLANKFGHGEYGDVSINKMVTDGVYLASQKMLKFYALTSNFNQKLSFLSGLHQAYEQGDRGLKLYQQAQALKNLSQFSGGKANQPGYIGAWSNQNTRATFGLVHTLQQYSMGIVGLYAEMADKSLRNHPELNPVQRTQARKAFSTMLATQVALAGGLGVPFAGATLAILEKVFGFDATAAVRQGLAKLTGSDEDDTGTAGLLTELAMTGLPNQLFGVDLASRMGANGVLGTSAYSGFDLKDMLGPTPNIIGNVVKALGYFATGEPGKAGQSLVPQAFKGAVELAKNRVNYGDFGFRDSSENLIYQPSNAEAVAYAAGLKPAVLSERRKAAQVIKASDDHYTARRSAVLDDLAQAMLGGDVASAQRWVSEQVQKDPMLNPDSLMKEISTRAVDMVSERDVLARGPIGNADARAGIAKTFNSSAVPHQSELQRAMLKEQYDAQLGALPGRTDNLSRAAMVDAFTGQGLSRGQASKYVEMLGL